MPYSSNPILRAARLPALPRVMSIPRRFRLRTTISLAIPQERANVCIMYYDFIMRNHALIPVFEEAYKSFYLRNTSRVWNERDYETYFSLLSVQKDLDPCADYLARVGGVASYLQQHLTGEKYWLSYASKLVHTCDDQCPIFDNQIMKYLRRFEHVVFPKDPRGKYKALLDWYRGFINSDPRFRPWMDWFDLTFPSWSQISPIKKIDFILFFCE